MGLELVADVEATDCDPCTYEEGQGGGAANALQMDVSQSQLLATFDSNLQRVIGAWGTLPRGIKTAVMTLVEHS